MARKELWLSKYMAVRDDLSTLGRELFRRVQSRDVCKPAKRLFWLPLTFAFVMTGFALMPTQLHAQASYTIYSEPQFLWNFFNVQDCGGCAGQNLWYTSLPQTWSYAQSVVDGTRDGSTWTAENLIATPGTTQFEGSVAAENEFGVNSCNSGGCNYLPNTGYIQTGYACPANAGAGGYDFNPPYEFIACALTIYNILPTCKSCFGNPILASTGEKRQVETDYSVAGLNFTRTYRSTNGRFSSIATSAIVNNSGPGAAVGERCYPSAWTYSTLANGYYCFPYVSAYPYTGSTPQYQLQTADGLSILFTGANNAITQNADINDRVTQITVNNVTEWRVARADDSIEIYDAGGSLIQKTLRGGKTFTFTYSTTSTPAEHVNGRETHLFTSLASKWV